MTAIPTTTVPAITTRPAAPADPALAGRRPPTARLVGLEIRKSLSTRSGRTLALTAALLPAIGIGIAMALGQKPPSAP